MVVIATAFTALVFKGSLIPYFSLGISCTLIGSIIVNLITSTRSSFRFAIARVEPALGAILAIIFANIASHHLPKEILLPTLLATLGVSSLLVAAALFFLGKFRLGHIIRFLPYPVLGGVITGMAWLMAQASFVLMTNGSFHFSMLQSDSLRYLLGIGFAIFLVVQSNYFSRVWILPISILVLSLLINFGLQLNHFSHADAVQSGWLFASFVPSFVFTQIDFSMLQQIDWKIIGSQLGYLLSFVGVMIILLLLNVSSLETTARTKADLDQELKIAGIGNFIGGLVSGVAANLSFSGTLLNKDAGAQSRASGLIASIVSLIVLFLYPDIVSFLPKPIIAGLLLFIALKLMLEWLYVGWKVLPHIDYFIVVFILLTIATTGLLLGMLVGILITCLVFIVRYARIDVIQFSTTAKYYHSNVIRPLYQQKWLADNGKSIHVFKLHGYLFFGSAKLLVDKVSKLIESDHNKDLRFLIFDFQLVNGVDSSASFSFVRLQQLIEGLNCQLVFTHCAEDLITQFKQEGRESLVRIFRDLDQGMEWCEDELLKTMPDSLKPLKLSIKNTLSQLIADENQQKLFVKFLEKIDVPEKFYLVRQGEYVDCLYFIESGEISVLLKSDHAMLRLSKSGPGTVIGEIGFYLHATRSATVITDTPCVIYKLTHDAMKNLESQHPEIALAFHKSIVHVLAMRVVQMNYELKLVSQ